MTPKGMKKNQYLTTCQDKYSGHQLLDTNADDGEDSKMTPVSCWKDTFQAA